MKKAEKLVCAFELRTPTFLSAASSFFREERRMKII
jgi:hypothetical protein